MEHPHDPGSHNEQHELHHGLQQGAGPRTSLDASLAESLCECGCGWVLLRNHESDEVVLDVDK